MKQNFVIFRKTPLSALAARSSRSFPRRLVAGKAPWLAAHYVCRLARCACRSSFPKISLRCDFREPCLFSRARHYQNAAASPFLHEPNGKLGALAQKRGFACARIIFYCIRNFTFYILHLPFAQARGRGRCAVRRMIAEVYGEVTTSARARTLRGCGGARLLPSAKAAENFCSVL